MYGNFENAQERLASGSKGLAQVQASFINRVYGWMCGGLAITGIISWLVASNKEFMTMLIAHPILFFGLIIVELVMVGSLGVAVNKMSAAVATAIYVGYAALNGVVLSLVFYNFTAESLATTFFATAGTFGAMSLYGYVTKRDLTSIGNLCFMALIGLIIASVVNMFWANSMLYWITTYVGILIFVGLTAYDTQKIKQMSVALGDELSETDSGKKFAIMGALTLYLDFINLFLLLLRIFGGRRD
ncbi:MAG: Bax inhibitor-1/YccA family protein [Victivallaceae bacterium]